MGVKQFDRGQVQQCVAVLDAYAQSGLGLQAFAQAHGMSYHKLRAWPSFEGRWRAQLAGQVYVPRAHRSESKGEGFVRLQVGTDAGAQAQTNTPPHSPNPSVACTPTPTVHIVCTQGPRSAVLHWPSTAPLECAQWLRAYLEPLP